MAQINPIIGDLHYNAKKIQEHIQEFKVMGVDLAVFPELSLTGYPPKDLLLRDDFLKKVEEIIHKYIVPASQGIGMLIGMPLNCEKGLYNAAVLLHDGNISDICYKTLLPDYDVFDESRYFKPSPHRKCIEFAGMKLGVTICEDIWNDKDYWDRRRYDIDPVAELVAQGAEILINISASPYHYGKCRFRANMLANTAKKYGTNVVYVNQVGGNDDLIFDGSSCVLNGSGLICFQMDSFREDVLVFNTESLPECNGTPVENIHEDTGWIYKALVLGIRDYFIKTGFKKAVVGLSGGIDSSVTAALAVAALGRDNVLGVSMPSRYSSSGSLTDARELAKNLGIEYRVIPVESMFSAYLKELNPGGGSLMDLAEENVQARIRGSILMFISNREGCLVLITGNKSEMAMGYSTLYGDMCGGLGVLADVPKTMVYRLAHYINCNGKVIPESVIKKPPSAELKPGQVDQDSLPPYEELDAILKAYIEYNKPVPEIVEMGFSRDVVENVIRRADRNEYKRQQAAPGIRVTSRAFGPGRRMPIAHRWTGWQ